MWLLCGAFDQIASHMATSQSPRFTETQGQYLAFIHAYTLVNGRPPAEADVQRFFGVTPPSVHNMIVELERRGLITRVPRQPRSIAITVADDEFPRLRQPIKTTLSGYEPTWTTTPSWSIAGPTAAI